MEIVLVPRLHLPASSYLWEKTLGRLMKTQFPVPCKSLWEILRFILRIKWGEGEYQVITVDCADKCRVGDTLSKRFPKVDLNIDHHVSNTNYGEENFILSDASATGEILAKFFFDSGYEVDQTTAEALYLGICTDTGQFCYSATNASVFEVCRLLCEAGAVLQGLHTNFTKKKNPAASSFSSVFLPVSKWNMMTVFVLALF